MKTKQTPRQRLFTNEFSLGDKVRVTRHEHGWHDGALAGVITHLTDNFCVVTDIDGVGYEINHPRDIHKDRW